MSKCLWINNAHNCLIILLGKQIICIHDAVNMTNQFLRKPTEYNGFLRMTIKSRRFKLDKYLKKPGTFKQSTKKEPVKD